MYEGGIKGEKSCPAVTRTPSASFNEKIWSVSVYLRKTEVGLWEFSMAGGGIRVCA